ncbi:MAG TPA: protein-disulfide reductase DsbD domain-containing protein [Candidatus Acidoferrales bacterium]|nr:protein-disulfide reductase DsbD domain-containing protein [Candidatus Acidoferrales bacterium]
MKLVRPNRDLCTLCALLLISGGAIALAQEAVPLKSAASVVKTHAYVSLDPVPRGKDFQVGVVVSIENGYHMNSHKPSDSYLIPTTLTPQLPAGIHLADTVYPNGELKKFSFSDKPLDVYSGSVTLRLKLTAQESAPVGSTTIPMTLRYQACNNSACLPPVKVPVSVQLQVGAAGAHSKAVNPGIFSAGSSKDR